MVDKRKAAIFVGSVAAAFSICVAAWRFKKNEKKEEPGETQTQRIITLEGDERLEIFGD